MPVSQSTETIMVVDDTPGNLMLLEYMLRESGYRVLTFPRGDLALKAAERNPPDLVLLDIDMPDMDGYQVCDRLKADPRLKNIPVLFLSAFSETSDKVKAFSAGGQDYVTKPFQPEEVMTRVRTHLQLSRLSRELEAHNTRLAALVEEKVRQLVDSHIATISALAKLTESRDDDTGLHIERTRLFCRKLAEQMVQT